MSRFYFQEVNHLHNRHAMRRHDVPTPFHHVPQSIRDSAVWPQRSVPLQHRIHRHNLGETREWGASRENLFSGERTGEA